jgi:hypothetical protein
MYVQLCIDGDMLNVGSRKCIEIKTGDGDVVYMTSRGDGIWMATSKRGVKYRTCDGDVVYMTRTVWSIMTYLEKLYMSILRTTLVTEMLYT